MKKERRTLIGNWLPVALTLVFLVSANPLAAKEPWWQFLGPAGNGHSSATDLPLNWSEKENVAWKTRIHDRGWSSPVISGTQIWMTTATADGHKLFAVCVDKNTGRIVHNRCLLYTSDAADDQ